MDEMAKPQYHKVGSGLVLGRKHKIRPPAYAYAALQAGAGGATAHRGANSGADVGAEAGAEVATGAGESPTDPKTVSPNRRRAGFNGGATDPLPTWDGGLEGHARPWEKSKSLGHIELTMHLSE